MYNSAAQLFPGKVALVMNRRVFFEAINDATHSQLLIERVGDRLTG